MTKEKLKKMTPEAKLDFLDKMENKMHLLNQMILSSCKDKLKRKEKLWAADLKWLDDMIDAIEEKK